MLRKTKIVLISGVAAVAVAGAGIGVAEAADSSQAPAPSPAPKPVPSAPAHPGRHPGMLARVAHGQFTLNGKQHRTVDIQRGVVQAVDATSVTVRSSDGFTARYALNANTKVRKNKQQANNIQVAVNDRVMVLATVNGSAMTATRITDNGPAPASH